MHIDWPSCRCADCEAYRINLSAKKQEADVTLSEENDALVAEVDRLKKENDWLADRLHDAVSTCYGGVTHDQIDARSY